MNTTELQAHPLTIESNVGLIDRIKLTLSTGGRVLWEDFNADAGGYLRQTANGIFIISSDNSRSMPLLWSDGKTFTRPLTEFIFCRKGGSVGV